MSNSPVLDTATAFLANGWVPVASHPGTKKPSGGDGWQNNRPTLADLPALFSNGENLGLLLGSPSGDLTDVDPDTPQAVRVAPYFLPPTPMRHGRPSKRVSHWWYVCHDAITEKYYDPDPPTDGTDKKKKNMVIELRANGQTITPPSTHAETGEPISWEEGELEPARVRFEELRTAVRRIAAAAVLARRWPNLPRQDTTLAVAGFLARGDMAKQDALTFVKAVADAGDDEEGPKRLAAVEDTYEKFAKGEKVTGGPRLAELVGKKVVSKLVEWLGLSVPDRTRNTEGAVAEPVLVRLADVQPREVDWLWLGRIPLGRIALLVGRPGEGKSFLTTDMAARVTTGSPWPDGSLCPKGSVILICAEDDPSDTVRPRLDAHGADCKKVHLLSAVRRVDAKGKHQDVMFTLADVDALEAALQVVGDCQAIFIDPVGSFLGGRVDSHRDNEVRAVLAPVAVLAEKYGPAVVIVVHRRKAPGTMADDLALGSVGFTGIARAVWHLSRDKDNKSRRLLLPGKNNLGPEGYGLAFSIGGDPPKINWEEDPVAMSADDALAIENDEGEAPERLTPAGEWLQTELQDYQEHLVKDLKAAAKAVELPWRSVQRAAGSLGVKIRRIGFGQGGTWQLPKPDPCIRATDGMNGNNGTDGANGVNEAGGQEQEDE